MKQIEKANFLMIIPLFILILCLGVIGCKRSPAEQFRIDSELIESVKQEKVDVARDLLKKGAEVNTRDSEGRTPLHHAMDKMNKEMMILLMENGADVDAVDNRNLTVTDYAHYDDYSWIMPLVQKYRIKNAKHTKQDHETADTSELYKRIVEIIRNNPDKINLLNETTLFDCVSGSEIKLKCSILIEAVAANHSKSVKKLIKSRADVNTRTVPNGFTPLHFASACGHEKIVRLLLDNGAQINSRNDTGKTPLIVAATHGHADIVKILLKNGADVNMQTKDGTTAIFMASFTDHKDIVELLIKGGANIFLKIDEGKSPLAAAEHQNNTDIIEILKEEVNRNAINLKMANAAAINDWDTMIECIKNGANINFQNPEKYRETPLIAAILRGDEELVNFCIDSGANIDVRTDEGDTPLHIAVKAKKDHIARLLIRKGANLNIFDDDGVSPFVDATYNNQNEIAQIMVENGFDFKKRNELGYTPLHYLVMTDQKTFIELALQDGVDINAQGENNLTPLHLAASGGYLESVKLLVDAGADLTARDLEGRSPLYYANAKGQYGVANFLRDHGAN